MAEFNINNLVLDDNSFEVLPDGDYRFRVASHEIGFAQSENFLRILSRSLAIWKSHSDRMEKLRR